MKGLCDSWCSKCVYYASSTKSCDYTLSHKYGLRGCPAGHGCDKRLIGKRKTPKDIWQETLIGQRKMLEHIEKAKERARQKPKKRGIQLSRKEHNYRMSLYDLGWTDARIADACNVAERTIASWRKRNGLPSKNDPRITRRNAQ